MENFFAQLPQSAPTEIFEVILQQSDFKLERILSFGQTTEPGKWYDQDTNEWVLLLKGKAELLFKENLKRLVMVEGDYVQIPAHQLHRVEWTAPQTVWLALHYK